MRVLLVEDDSMIGATVLAALREAGYAVDWVDTGLTALAAQALHPYDFVLLDLGLPDMDGRQLLRRIRAQGHAMPLIVITARDPLDQRLGALDDGADDYLVKPFALSELLARMRVVLRRETVSIATLLGNGTVTVDPNVRKAWRSGGEPVALTAREYALLHTLISRAGAILSRSDLESRIYGWGEEVESNAVEYLIHNVRRKLGTDVIRNVRGVGWMVPAKA